MKIALQTGLPDAESLQTFLQALGNPIPVKQLIESAGKEWMSRVVAAYDDGKLVGLAHWINADEDVATPKVHYYIAPGYEHRGLEEPMSKLLLPLEYRLEAASM